MIRIKNIKISVAENQDDALNRNILKKLNGTKIIDKKIVRRSIDARKEIVSYVYEVDVRVASEKKIKFNEFIFPSPKEEYVFPVSSVLKTPVTVVGSGPAGLFCAYFLAKVGCDVTVIERGEDVDKRVKTVDNFWNTGILNENSNVQFGEGGAGTFSDGKLNTLVKDKLFRGKKVLELFVECGAPEEILFDSKPHIGTDKLRIVVKNLREKIKDMGGKFLYNTLLTDIIVENDSLVKIEINHEQLIDCNHLVLAIGHSARDTFQMLFLRGLKMSAKPFAVGVRVEHKQSDINKNQYREYAKYLPPASYKLTYTTKSNRGVYTFCMCPGGYVVNASSENKRLVINGMSNYKRESFNANSAVLVTVTPRDFGDDPLSGIEFQRNLEEKVYQYGNGLIPTQRYEDFLKNEKTKEFKSIKPIHKGNTVTANLNEILPDFLSNAIKEGMDAFGKKINGFNHDDVLLSAIEARSSSPIKIERSETCESNIHGIYPCGEGSGYAGGITTSAMDGMRVAEEICKKH